MSKKIAFLSHLDLNLYLFRLPIMIELVKKGYEVYAVCPKGDKFDKFQEYGVKAVSYNINRSSLNPVKEIITIKNIKKTISCINPDILHTFMHKPNIYGNFINHPCTINTVTGLGSFFIYNDIKSKIIKIIIKNLYKYSSGNTKKIIFQNKDDLQFFIDNKIFHQNKTILIRSSGINTDFFKPFQKCKKLLKELKLENKIIILMIARVIRDKGVEEYIEAANILKNKAIFLYAGNFDKGNKNIFIPNWKNVIYLGFRKDIKELISICDIFVLPSYREGVPRTLLEASSMAKPIVTTNAIGCREVVEDKKNGFLVPVRNHKVLADKIQILIDNKQLREKFGKYGRNKVIREFDIKVVVSKYLEVYQNLFNI